MKNKGFTLMELLSVLVIIGIIAVITTTLISSNIRASKEQAYNVQITEIEEAAKKWVSANSDSMDSYNLNTICLTIDKMQKDDILSPNDIKNPKTGKKLTGKVEIVYDFDKNQYKYKYKDDCKEIKIKPAYETLVVENEDNIKISGTDDGLYETIDSYIYKGLNPNNFIKIDNQIWRIINIDKSSKELRVVKLEDNQVNYDKNMLENLNSEYNTEGSIYSSIKQFIKENPKINIGSYDEISSLNTVSTIEKSKNDYKTISLLTASDYMNASTNLDCFKNAICNINNYLNNSKSFYLLNSNVDQDKTWFVDKNGIIQLDSQTDALRHVYPVINLKLSTQISGGDGSELNPYVVS